MTNDYEHWVQEFDTLDDAARSYWRRKLRRLRRQPLISVLVPVYNPELRFLEAAIESVRRQVYPAWEICLADDASTDESVRPFLQKLAREDERVRVIFRERNGHIAACSNSALELARGEWCALLDQDDELAEIALAAVACEIEAQPRARLIYSDEDKIDADGRRSNPYFKSDWNPELFYGQNFVNHLSVFASELLREIGGFREGFEGSQDYDLVLRCVEKIERDQIRHLPRVLYHWRTIEGSVAGDVEAKPYAKDAARRAIADHLQRSGIDARVEPCPEDPLSSHRVIYELREPPLVSVVIPTRDGVALLEQCVRSLRERTDYAPLELVIVDNGSVEPATQDYFRTLEKQMPARVVRDDEPFNFSRLINRGAGAARGEVLAILNNDIEAENPDWLREMVSYAVRPQVGAVGARLWFPNGTLQHGGVVVGLGGVAGHALHRMPREHAGYFNNTMLTRNCTALTAACLVVRKEIFQRVGGFDETNLAVSFNDVDFCLKIAALGLLNVWTPYANLTHHESATRGHPTGAEAQAQFVRESYFMQEKWGARLLHDPFYNPNLTLVWPGFTLAFPPLPHESP